MHDPQPSVPVRDPQAGFTLIEAMVAMVVLIFGLMAVTNLLLVAATSNTVANQSTAAVAVASSVMDQLRASSFEVLAAGAGGSLTADTGGFNRDDSFPGVGTVHTRWQIVAAGGDGRALFITVQSQGTGALSGARSRASFTAFRTCANTLAGCP